MTEAFEKWVEGRIHEGVKLGGYDIEIAHFWLSAFVKEVEQQYNQIIKNSPDPDAAASFSNAYHGKALAELVRDFGLEKRKP